MDREKKTKKTEKKKKYRQAIIVAMQKEIIEKHKQCAILMYLCSMYGKPKSTIFFHTERQEKAHTHTHKFTYLSFSPQTPIGIS